MEMQKSSYDLLLEKLDRFIRKFYLNQLVRGLLYSTAIILSLFLFFSLLENFFYFDTSVRKLIFFGFIGVSFASIGLFMLMPVLKYFKLGRQIDHEQAAVIIGDHFSDVKDRLLNILQLKKQSDDQVSKELILASINQKSEQIKLVPFRSAIDLGKNRKYLKYALPPALMLLGIFLASPTMITKSTHRIINNNTEFEKEAPFHFRIINEDLKAVQYDDYTVYLETDGSVVPNEVFIDVEDFQYRMKKTADNAFSYTFKNVQKDQNFEFFSGFVRSKEYDLEVLPKAKLSAFSIDIDYPSYISRKDETVSNIGDLVIPTGTSLTWNFDTENTDEMALKFSSDGIVNNAERRSDEAFRYERRILKDEQYKLFYSNELVSEPDSVFYNIKVLADEYPEISVESFRDSLENTLVYFIGNASDDYGLVSLNFNYTVSKANGSELEETQLIENPKSRSAQYSYTLDITELDLRPGDKLSYYFEAYDNDAVNGSKSARTHLMEFEKPTLEEFEEKEEENEDEIKETLEESLKESKKIKEELKKLRDKMLQKQKPDWEDRKELEKLLERQKELEEKLKEAKEKFDENLKNQEEFTDREDEIKEKQEKLQELFEEAIDSETQELMDKIQELLEELDKESMIEEMENMQLNEESMEKNTERLLELFKNLEVEKEIKDLTEKLDELSEKQDSLADETKKAEEVTEEMKQDQEDLNKEFDKLQEKMDEIQEKNEDLQRPKDMGEDPEGKMDEIKKDMQKSQESLDQQKSKKASKQQKNAAQKMKQMSQEMQSAMESMQMDQMQEDIAALRQLLENLVTLSFDQEDLVDALKVTRINTPSYVGHIQQQFKLKDDFGMIQDSLQELAKRVDNIQSYVMEKVVDIEKDMIESIDQLEERETAEAEARQRRTMKNVNDLALMLSESMQQMQQQMSGMMSGSQMCNKPGGVGGKPGDVPMDKITEGQQQLSEDMKKKMEGMKEGKDGKDGKDGMSAKEFAEAAARQAALRKALEEIHRENLEQGKGDKGLQEMIDAMDEIETDLVNKRLDNEMLLRQQDILTRLLEAEEAEKQREFDNARKAEQGRDQKKELPPALKEYLKEREAELEMYNKVSPSLRPYYKNLVDEYYKALKRT